MVNAKAGIVHQCGDIAVRAQTLSHSRCSTLSRNPFNRPIMRFSESLHQTRASDRECDSLKRVCGLFYLDTRGPRSFDSSS